MEMQSRKGAESLLSKDVGEGPGGAGRAKGGPSVVESLQVLW